MVQFGNGLVHFHGIVIFSESRLWDSIIFKISQSVLQVLQLSDWSKVVFYPFIQHFSVSEFPDDSWNLFRNVNSGR